MWVERFWVKVNKGDGTGCWLWTAALKDGYGMFNRDGKTSRASRLSFEIHHGRPAVLDVLHTCDIRACVRPDHLYEGDALQNAADREARGRGNHVRGEKSGRALLAEREVRAIKILLGKVPQEVLATQFGVRRHVVADISAGRSWAHVG